MLSTFPLLFAGGLNTTSNAFKCHRKIFQKYKTYVITFSLQKQKYKDIKFSIFFQVLTYQFFNSLAYTLTLPLHAEVPIFITLWNSKLKQ